MKKSKVLQFAFLTLVLAFLSCSKNDESQNSVLRTKLTNLESDIKINQISARSEYDLNSVQTENNPYEGQSAELYSLLCGLQDRMESLEKGSSFEDDVQPIIDSLMNYYSGYSSEFSNDEQVLNDSFCNSLSANEDKIAVAKSYEKFVLDNFPNVSRVENFMKYVGTVKYLTLKTTKKRNFTVREICANDCMRDEFASWNPIQWAAATVSFLGGSLFWMYASCWYDCW